MSFILEFIHFYIELLNYWDHLVKEAHVSSFMIRTSDKQLTSASVIMMSSEMFNTSSSGNASIGLGELHWLPLLSFLPSSTLTPPTRGGLRLRTGFGLQNVLEAVELLTAEDDRKKGCDKTEGGRKEGIETFWFCFSAWIRWSAATF